MKTIILLLALAAYCSAQQQQYTTPVPILKQINRHNEDGSYSYGYENADGSFKIESKYPDGQVYGKYGYVDDSGKVREVEYGASRRGFEPAGTGIQVPPPTLTNNNYNAPLQGGVDDGQYREDPSVYYKDSRYNSITNNQIQPKPAYRAPPRQSFFNEPPQQQQQQGQGNYYYNNNVNQQQPRYQPPQPQYEPPQPRYQPQQPYRPQPQYYNPAPPVDQNIFRGHPAQNLDINTGSYTVNYSG